VLFVSVLGTTCTKIIGGTLGVVSSSIIFAVVVVIAFFSADFSDNGAPLSLTRLRWIS
jgi:hypothetical protein